MKGDRRDKLVGVKETSAGGEMPSEVTTVTNTVLHI